VLDPGSAKVISTRSRSLKTVSGGDGGGGSGRERTNVKLSYAGVGCGQ
jgi:hypothetical protein